MKQPTLTRRWLAVPFAGAAALVCAASIAYACSPQIGQATYQSRTQAVPGHDSGATIVVSGSGLVSSTLFNLNYLAPSVPDTCHHGGAPLTQASSNASGSIGNTSAILPATTAGLAKVCWVEPDFALGGSYSASDTFAVVV